MQDQSTRTARLPGSHVKIGDQILIQDDLCEVYMIRNSYGVMSIEAEILEPSGDTKYWTIPFRGNKPLFDVIMPDETKSTA